VFIKRAVTVFPPLQRKDVISHCLSSGFHGTEKGKERDRDERRGGKKTRWKQREGVRKKRKESGKEQERGQGGDFIFIFLNILQITKHCLFIGNSIS